jgi:hypothetical protein
MKQHSFSLAGCAGALLPQVLEREDTLVSVIPLDEKLTRTRLLDLDRAHEITRGLGKGETRSNVSAGNQNFVELTGAPRAPSCWTGRNGPPAQNRFATDCGAEGDRTLDLLNAIQALSQLSYSPKLFAVPSPALRRDPRSDNELSVVKFGQIGTELPYGSTTRRPTAS